MEQAKVSIIIPVFNGANYLYEAVESALKQTYKNMEIIVINDGSTDNNETEKIALSFGNKIQYIKKENGGVASALNMGVMNMTGEYFSWLSHDDLYYPYKIEREMQELEGRLTNIVYSNYDILDIKTNQKLRALDRSELCSEHLQYSLYPVLRGAIHGCTLLIHKSHFDRVGLFDEKLITTQDYDLWFKMFRNQKLIYIEDSLIISRLHDEQGSKTIKTHFKEEAQLRLKFLRELNDIEIEKYYGNKYNFYYQFLIYCRRKGVDEFNYILSEFKKQDMPQNTCVKINKLKAYIKKISNGQADKLCIFGAGQYGLHLYYELKYRFLEVNYFSDNDQSKWGKNIYGISCVEPEKIDKEKTLVIVSMKYPEIVIKQLKDQGFKYIVTKQKLEKSINDTPPLKWLIVEENLKKIDYASPEVMELINKYNQIIFEVCQYYEEKEGDMI